MLEFLFQYGLFLIKTLTLCVGIIVTLGFVLSMMQKGKSMEGSILITNINDKLDDLQSSFEEETFSKHQRKALLKARKANEKKKKNKKNEEPSRLFVVRFDGDLRASEVDNLREIITALLSTAQKKDEILVVVDSGGGYVHQYGLAASQLKRIRSKGIPLTVAVDKIAASGGYLMACVANKIIAAPFAIVGSIGVVGQVPNFHKLLEKHHIDFEQHTAGEYKRTLTMFGENTNEGRKKFKEELEVTQTLFKAFIGEHRPQVNLHEVATGEHWYASNAVALNLVDELMASDDYISKHHPERRIFEVSYATKENLRQKLASSLSLLFQKAKEGFISILNPSTPAI